MDDQPDLEWRHIWAAYQATEDEEAFANALERYWKTGPGAARVRWGTPGSFRRCVRLIGKHVTPDDRARRICAQWEHDVTGRWPGEKRGKNPTGPG